MKSKQPKLTTKQAKFVKGISEGKTQVASALEAYNTTDYQTASVIASENLSKPNIQEAIQVAMTKLNLTPETIIKPIADALNSEDINIRLKGSDRALKLLLPKDNKQEETKPENPYHIIYIDSALDREPTFRTDNN